MEKHSENFEKFIFYLRKSIPSIQADIIAAYPDFNPCMNPQPLNWFYDSFHWFVAIDLIPGNGYKYGPFYQIGSELFWPQIGIPGKDYSEKKCWFAFDVFESEEMDAKARINRLEKSYCFLKNSPLPSHIHKFSIPGEILLQRSQLYAGPVKGGDGIQANPNTNTLTSIRRLILESRVETAAITDGRLKFT